MLRGLAILGVVLFHLWSFTAGHFFFGLSHATLLARLRDRIAEGSLPSMITAASDLALRSGADGVTVFFTLSGLGLTLAALRSNGPVRPRDFYIRRPLRILRAYWVGILVVAVFLALLAIPKMLIDDVSYSDAATKLGYITYYDRSSLLASVLVIPRGFKAGWAVALPSVLWFVFLLLQFYLLFPYLFRLAQQFGFARVLLGSLLLSIASTAALIGITGSYAAHAWVPAIWSPFRLFDFSLGMALGYVFMVHGSIARRMVAGALPTLILVVLGLTLYFVGASSLTRTGYVPVLAYPLIAIGLACASLPLLAKRPDRLEASFPGRLLIWIGPMSLTVLVMNEPFRLVDHYLWLKHVE